MCVGCCCCFGYAFRIYLIVAFIILQLLPHGIVILFMYRALECYWIPKSNNFILMFGYIAYFYKRPCINLSELDFPPGMISPVPESLIKYTSKIPKTCGYVPTRYTWPQTPSPGGRRKRAVTKKESFFQNVFDVGKYRRNLPNNETIEQIFPSETIKKLADAILGKQNDNVSKILEELMQNRIQKVSETSTKSDPEQTFRPKKQRRKKPKKVKSHMIPWIYITHLLEEVTTTQPNRHWYMITQPSGTNGTSTSTIDSEFITRITDSTTMDHPWSNTTLRFGTKSSTKKFRTKDHFLVNITYQFGTDTSIKKAPRIYITRPFGSTFEENQSPDTKIQSTTATSERTTPTYVRRSRISKKSTCRPNKTTLEDFGTTVDQSTKRSSANWMDKFTEKPIYGLAKPLVPYFKIVPHDNRTKIRDKVLKEILSKSMWLNPQFWDEDKVEWLISLMDPTNWILYFMKLIWGDIPPNSLVTMLTQPPYVTWPTWASFQDAPRTQSSASSTIPSKVSVPVFYHDFRGLDNRAWPPWWDKFATEGQLTDWLQQPVRIMWPTYSRSYSWVKDIVYAYMILDLLWIASCSLLILGACIRTRGPAASFFYLPFIMVTLAIQVIDVVSATYFAITMANTYDFVDYLSFVGVLNVPQLRDPRRVWFPYYQKTHFHPSWILTLFFSRFLILWILNWVMLCRIIHIFRRVLGQKVLEKDIIMQQSCVEPICKTLLYKPVCPKVWNPCDSFPCSPPISPPSPPCYSSTSLQNMGDKQVANYVGPLAILPSMPRQDALPLPPVANWQPAPSTTSLRMEPPGYFPSYCPSNYQLPVGYHSSNENLQNRNCINYRYQ